MKFISIIIWNIILNIVIIASGTIFSIHAMYSLMFERNKYKFVHQDKDMETSDVFVEQLRGLTKKFWKSFYILESTLILYFVFWGLIFSGLINTVI